MGTRYAVLAGRPVSPANESFEAAQNRLAASEGNSI